MTTNILWVRGEDTLNVKFIKKVRSFHSTRNNEMLRRLGIGVGTAVGAAYGAKKAYDVVKKEATVDVSVHLDKGEVSGTADIFYGKAHLAGEWNVPKAIEPGSKSGATKELPSIFESFDLYCLDTCLIIFLSLGTIIELMVIYAFFYRLYSFGLKGTLEWLDSHIEKALKTPVTFLLIIFSIYLFGLIMLAFYTIGVLTNSIGTLCEGFRENRDGLLRVIEISGHLADRMNKDL